MDTVLALASLVVIDEYDDDKGYCYCLTLLASIKPKVNTSLHNVELPLSKVFNVTTTQATYELKPALRDDIFVFVTNSRSCVALEIQFKRYNVVEPIGGQIQDIAWLHYHFVCIGFCKIWKLIQIGIGVINLRMPCRGMALRVQLQCLAWCY